MCFDAYLAFYKIYWKFQTIDIRVDGSSWWPSQTSMQVPQVGRMASGIACPVGGARWLEWLAGRVSTAGGGDYHVEETHTWGGDVLDYKCEVKSHIG